MSPSLSRLTAIALISLVACGPAATSSTPPASGDDAADEAQADQQPQFTLYVMSKCPHCARALRAIIPLARELGDRFPLRVEYLGGIDEGLPVSLHGPDEVVGDIVELCVHQSAPRDRWLDFLECYHERWRQIPDGWQECAAENQIEIAPVESCVDGAEGIDLVLESFTRAAVAGVNAAPTFVAGDAIMVGVRPPSVIAQLVCSRLDEPLPQLCALVDPLPYVPVTLVTDERCQDPRCDPEVEERALKSVIWGAEVNRMAYQSEPGRALYREAGLKGLPAVVIGAELEDDREAMRHLEGMRRGGPYFIKNLGRFDPQLGRWVEPQPVTVRLLNDARCPEDDCSTRRIEEALRDLLSTVEIVPLDVGSEDGRALHQQLRAANDGEPVELPLLLFSRSVEGEEEFFGRLSEQLTEVEAGYVMSLGEWNPDAEICDNEADDDGDGDADCDDADCDGLRACRPLEQRRLDLFAMSQCPFGVQVFRAMKMVVEHFGRDRDAIDFHVQYIGRVTDEGGLRSMHGSAEVEENLRQVCVQEHYGSDYAFMDYLDCRAQNYRLPDWEQCVSPPLDAATIRRCAEGEEGRRLLRESFERAEQLEITGSPSWLLNNRHEMEGRTPRAIIEAFCERNPGPACERPLPEPAAPTDEPLGDGGCG